jgi:3-hydroxybutyryl-CoA dehydrogenase
MKISILGSGQMGRDIAVLLSQSDEIDSINLIVTNSNLRTKEKELADYYILVSNEFKKKHDISLYNKIKFTDSLSVLKDSNFVIESVSEDFEIKKSVINKANQFIGEETLFFSNTSSLSIEKLSNEYRFKDKFIGLHFFNPAIKSKLVEIAVPEENQIRYVRPIISLLEDLGRTVLLIKDYPGYIVNRLILAQINEALSILEDGIASPSEIDSSFKIATNSLIGPLGLSDFIGNDVVLSMMENLYEETNKDKFKANEVIKDMVKKGMLGVKTKAGFFKY